MIDHERCKPWHTDGRQPLRLPARPREQRTAKRGSIALPTAATTMDALKAGRGKSDQALEQGLADSIAQHEARRR
jgi:hypothetical protein